MILASTNAAITPGGMALGGWRTRRRRKERFLIMWFCVGQDCSPLLTKSLLEGCYFGSRHARCLPMMDQRLLISLGPVMIGLTEDLVVALFSCALERAGEGGDCLVVPNDIDDVDWMYSLSDNGVNNDNGLFVVCAGDAYGGSLLLLAGWQINLIACSRWANRTTRDHACRQVEEPIAAMSAAVARGTKTPQWHPLPLVMLSTKIRV